MDRYQVYAASYSHLVLEIERRKKAMEKQNELYQELLKSFEDSYDGKYHVFRCLFIFECIYLFHDINIIYIYIYI